MEFYIEEADMGGAVAPKLDCPHVHANYNKAVVDEKLKMASLRPGLLHPCVKCESTKENWICLCCGEIACSRYVNTHSEEHWMSRLIAESGAEGDGGSHHTLSLSFSDLNVWCYECGEYIKNPAIIDTLYLAESVKFDKEKKTAAGNVASIEEEEEEEKEKEEEEDEGKGKKEEEETAISTIKKIDVNSDSFPVAIYWHPACEAHCIPNHPEQPARARDILASLRAALPENAFRLAPKVTDDQILLFHQEQTLLAFKKKAQLAETYYKNTGKTEYLAFDSDTQVMHATRAAAYHAAGSICASVDDLFLPSGHPDKISTSFCCVRPPGHHAEPNKSMGFCFLCNSGIGARYAQDAYGESHGIKKVAVIDFDVHHGNGVEAGFKNDPTLFYGSTHEKDNFPGTGPDQYPNIGDKAKDPKHRRIVNRYLDGGDSKISRRQFFPRWQFVVDEMERFAPDLVIFSAGFDAHGEDPIGNCWLKDEDFKWATDVVLLACKRINPDKPPPCLSILEGGYDLAAISSSAVEHVRSLAAGFPEIESELKAEIKKEVVGEVAALQETLKEMGI